MTSTPGTTENAPATEQSVLSDADKLRLYRLLSHTPYSGNIFKVAHYPNLPIETVDDLMGALTKLSDTLVGIVDHVEQTEQKLRNLQRTVRGGRDLLRLLMADDEQS